jgi:hypothetical protein
LVDIEPEATVKVEDPQVDSGEKTGVQQQKPGRPRLHRRQQSLFLPSAMRRSLVSILMRIRHIFNETEIPLI